MSVYETSKKHENSGIHRSTQTSLLLLVMMKHPEFYFLTSLSWNSSHERAKTFVNNWHSCQFNPRCDFAVFCRWGRRESRKASQVKDESFYLTNLSNNRAASIKRIKWKTSFHMACKEGHFDVVELMLNY